MEETGAANVHKNFLLAELWHQRERRPEGEAEQTEVFRWGNRNMLAEQQEHAENQGPENWAASEEETGG